MLSSFCPDVVHCHNLFPLLSPAAIRAAWASHTPVVMTLHNYRLMCVSGNFLRDGRSCEDCLGHLPWRGVMHACYQGSKLGSGALATAVSVHRALHTFDRVTLFLADGEFVKQRHEKAGMFAGRIRAKPQFCSATTRRDGPGRYFVYVGRLHPEKGVGVLLEAWRDIDADLVIVGDGPQAASLRASAPARVTFTGELAGDEVPAVLREARALLVPSIWYEGSPRTIVEAYAAGVPVIASRIGALSDVVSDGRTGLLVTAGSPSDWAAAVERLFDDGFSQRLGENAYARWVREFHPERGLAHLEGAYRDAVALARKG
jgi:glycosyltransferase involved in cell wall biosynthesis